jgi:hypothetical protein
MRGGFDHVSPSEIFLDFGDEERRIWSATADTKKLELEGRNSQKVASRQFRRWLVNEGGEAV